MEQQETKALGRGRAKGRNRFVPQGAGSDMDSDVSVMPFSTALDINSSSLRDCFSFEFEHLRPIFYRHDSKQRTTSISMNFYFTLPRSYPYHLGRILLRESKVKLP